MLTMSVSDECVEVSDIPVDSTEPVYVWKNVVISSPTPSSSQSPSPPRSPSPPPPFENEWGAATSQLASVSWMMSVDGKYEPLGKPWVPFADGIVQRKGCEVFAVMDPSGCPLFIVGRLYRRDEHGNIDADTAVYTIIPIIRSMGRQVYIDFDAPTTAATIQRAFAFAQERGADIILIGDTAKINLGGRRMNLAELWFLTDGQFWYEKVLPVHVEGAPAFGFKKGPMPIEELRAIFRRATWEGFCKNWYPRSPEFWPKKTGIPEGGSAMEAFRYLREKEMEWLVDNGYMIYSATYSSVIGHGGGPEPYDYVCMWRRPGFVGDFQPFNPVIGQFVQYVGSWDDID